MSDLATLLAALASEARSAAVMVYDEGGRYSHGVCAHKAELHRLAAEGFAQAATLETKSGRLAARYHERALRSQADAAFWSRHADLMLEAEASAFEPA